MIKKLTALLLLSILTLAGCGDNTPSTLGGNEPGGGTEPGGGGDEPGGDPNPPSGPTKVTVPKHTLSDGTPPIDLNSVGEHVNETTWNSFKNGSASKFNNHYNYTYRYFVSGQTTYEVFTKNGYELSNSTGTYYYERISNKQYYYNRTKDGYERISSPTDFISHRSDVLAHEVKVHMFEYKNYEYDVDTGYFTYYISGSFSTMVMFQGGYLTYLRYTLSSPLTTYEIFTSFESTIDIPASYYYE